MADALDAFLDEKLGTPKDTKTEQPVVPGDPLESVIDRNQPQTPGLLERGVAAVKGAAGKVADFVREEIGASSPIPARGPEQGLPSGGEIAPPAFQGEAPAAFTPPPASPTAGPAAVTPPLPIPGGYGMAPVIINPNVATQETPPAIVTEKDTPEAIGRALVYGVRTSTVGTSARALMALARKAGIPGIDTPEDIQKIDDTAIQRMAAVLGSFGTDSIALIRAAKAAQAVLPAGAPSSVTGAVGMGGALGASAATKSVAEDIEAGKKPDVGKALVEGTKSGVVGAATGAAGGPISDTVLRILVQTGVMKSTESLLEEGRLPTVRELTEGGVAMTAIELAFKLADVRAERAAVAKNSAEAKRLAGEEARIQKMLKDEAAKKRDLQNLLDSTPEKPVTPGAPTAEPGSGAIADLAGRYARGEIDAPSAGKALDKALGHTASKIELDAFWEAVRVAKQPPAEKPGAIPPPAFGGQEATEPPSARTGTGTATAERPNLPPTEALRGEEKPSTAREAVKGAVAESPETQIRKDQSQKVVEAGLKAGSAEIPPPFPAEGAEKADIEADTGGGSGKADTSAKAQNVDKSGQTPTFRDAVISADIPEPAKKSAAWAADIVDQAHQQGVEPLQVIAKRNVTDTGRAWVEALTAVGPDKAAALLDNYARVAEAAQTPEGRQALAAHGAPSARDILQAARELTEEGSHGKSQAKSATEAAAGAEGGARSGGAGPERAQPPAAQKPGAATAQEEPHAAAGERAQPEEHPDRRRPRGRHERPEPVPPGARSEPGGGSEPARAGGGHHAGAKAADRGSERPAGRGDQPQHAERAGESAGAGAAGTVAETPRQKAERAAKSARARLRGEKVEQETHDYWHGSPTGDFGPGEHARAIHVGTRRAAKEALEARIGIPVEGEWNGKRRYGDTLLAGKRSLRSGKYGKYRESGHNMDAPEEDYYPRDRKERPTFAGGQTVTDEMTPSIFPVEIAGKMTNAPHAPHSDTKANATMAAQLKRGRAKRGFFYRNEGEDTGSISAVVPHPSHLRRLETDSLATPHGQPREYSSLQVDLPRDLADEMRAFGDQIPTEALADEGLERAPHVTVKWGLQTKDPNVVLTQLADVGPVSLTLGVTDVFETPDADVLMVKVDSPDLDSLHRDLVNSGLRGVEPHERYVPHATVAYLKKGEGKRYKGDNTFDGRTVSVSTLSFHPADGGAPTKLALGGPLTAATRVQGEGGEERAVAGMDPRLMGVLGRNLYSGDLGKIAVKEAIQNARDSIMALPDPTKGKLEITVNTESRFIAVFDTGIGMSPAVATKELVDIGGSHKPGADAAGGFGIAKVAIFANAAQIDITTVADADGKRWRTTLSGTGLEWADVTKGLRVRTEEVAPSVPTGTDLRLSIKEDVPFAKYDVSRWLGKFMDYSKTAFEVTLSLDGNNYLMRRNIETGIYDLLNTLNTPAGRMTILASPAMGSRERSYIDIHVLNRGVYQFEAMVPMAGSFKTPATIIVDISSASDPDSSDYPFRPDREGLRSVAQEPLEQWVKRKLSTAAKRAERETMRLALKNAPRIKGSGKAIFDTEQQHRVAVLESITQHDYIKELVQILAGGFKRMQAALTRFDPAFGKGVFAGISVSNAHLGLTIYGRGLATDIEGNLKGKVPPDRVLLNPYMTITEAMSHRERGVAIDYPEYVANSLVDTMLHEFGHLRFNGHDEDYSGILTRMNGWSRGVQRQLVSRLVRFLKGNNNAALDALTRDRDALTEGWNNSSPNSLFGKISDDLAAAAAAPDRTLDLAGGGGPGARPALAVHAGGGRAAGELAPGADLRGRDGAREPAESAAAGGAPGTRGVDVGVRPAGAGGEVQEQALGGRSGRRGAPAEAAGPGLEGAGGPGGRAEPARSGEGAGAAVAPALPGRGVDAAGGTAAPAEPGSGEAGLDFRPLVEMPVSDRFRGAHGLNREFLRKVTWRLAPGRKARLLQQTTPQNTDRQRAELAALLAEHPNALASEKAWMRMQFEAFGDTLLPAPPRLALAYAERPARLARLLAAATDADLATATEGLAEAQRLGAAYRESEDPALTALAALWAMLSRQKSPYFQEAGFLDAVQGGVQQHVAAAIAGEFTPKYFRQVYLPWANRVFPEASPGTATRQNLNAYGATFLRRLGPRLADLHRLFADPALDSHEVVRGVWDMRPGVIGIDDKVLKFIALITGRTDGLVLDRVQVNHLWGARPDQNFYDERGYGEILRGHRGLLIYKTLEDGLARVLPAAVERANRDRTRRGLQPIPESTNALFHWLTWIQRSAQEAQHPTIVALRQYAEGSAEPFERIFAYQGKRDTLRQGAQYGWMDGTSWVLYTGPDGRVQQFTPEAFDAAVGEAAQAAARVIPRNFVRRTAQAGALQPFWARPGADPDAWQRILNAYGIPARGVAADVVAPPEEPGLLAAPTRDAYGEPEYGAAGWILPGDIVLMTARQVTHDQIAGERLGPGGNADATNMKAFAAGWTRYTMEPKSGSVGLEFRADSEAGIRGAIRYLYDQKPRDVPIYVDSRLADGQTVGVGEFQNWQGAVQALFELITPSVGEQPKDAFVPAPEPVKSAAFRTWFGDSKVVDDDGDPLVVYHGTNHDFDIFGLTRANPESELGRAYYFTNSKADANRNYTGVGPDMDNRIEHRADQIFNELPEQPQYGTDEYTQAYTAARDQARGELLGDQPNVMPVYLRMVKPLVLDARNPENNPRISVARLQRAMQKTAAKYDLPGDLLWRDLDQMIETVSRPGQNRRYQYPYSHSLWEDTEISWLPVYDALHSLDRLMDLYEPDTNLILVGDFVRDVIKALGYDGVILESPEAMFRGMNLGPGDRHFIVWSPTQIKSAIGNRGTFSRRNPSIVRADARDPYSPLVDTELLRERLSRLNRAVDDLDDEKVTPEAVDVNIYEERMGTLRAQIRETKALLAAAEAANVPYYLTQDAATLNQDLSRTGTGDAALRQKVDPFYSRIERTLREKMPERATVAQVTALLKGPGLRADDVKWTRIPQWLAGKQPNDKVTKAEVLGVLGRYRVRIREKLLGPMAGYQSPEEMKRLRDRVSNLKTDVAQAAALVNSVLMTALKAGDLVFSGQSTAQWPGDLLAGQQDTMVPSETRFEAGDKRLTSVKDHDPWDAPAKYFRITYDVPATAAHTYHTAVVPVAALKLNNQAKYYQPYDDLNTAKVGLAKAEAALKRYEKLPVMEKTQYQGHKLPGGQNYRELLFTVDIPDAPDEETARQHFVATADRLMVKYDANNQPYVDRDLDTMGSYSRDKVREGKGQRWYKRMIDLATVETATQAINREAKEDLIEYSRAFDALKATEVQPFSSSHFGRFGRGLLAHMRFDERRGPKMKGADGKPRDMRVLFAEEFQTDHIQKIRKYGTRPTGAEYAALQDEVRRLDEARRKIKVEHNEIHGQIVELRDRIAARFSLVIVKAQDWLNAPGAPPAARADLEQLNRLEIREKEILDKHGEVSEQWDKAHARLSGPPPAPLEKGWEEMLLRRLIHWAAAHDFDAVAWTTGSQQATRYNIRSVIDEISFFQRGDGSYYVEARQHGETRLVRDHQSPAQLAEIFGQEVARRITESPEALPEDPPATLTELPEGWEIRFTPDVMFGQGRSARPSGVFEAVNPDGQVYRDVTTGNPEFAPEGSEMWQRMRTTFVEATLHQLNSQRLNEWMTSNSMAARALGMRDNLPELRPDGGLTFHAAPPAEPIVRKVGSLTGMALEIGAGPMQAFYDRKMVNIANDILKPWGQRVGTMPLAFGLERGSAVRQYRGRDYSAADLVDTIREMGGVLVKGTERDVDDAMREAANAEQAAVDITPIGRDPALPHTVVIFKGRVSQTVSGILGEGTEPDPLLQRASAANRRERALAYFRDALLFVNNSMNRLEQPLNFQEAMTIGRRDGGDHLSDKPAAQQGFDMLAKLLGGRYLKEQASKTEVPAIRLTPEMKASVLEGQPLMQRTRDFHDTESPGRLPSRGPAGRAGAVGASPDVGQRAGDAADPAREPRGGDGLAARGIAALQRGVDVATVLGSLAAPVGASAPIAGGVRLYGMGVMRNMVDQGSVNFTGLVIKDSRDLARVAQVIRNPLYETFWLFVMRGKTVVAVRAVTSKMPSASYSMSPAAINEAVNAAGGTGYYILHNHPSGDPEPSDADVSATLNIERNVPGFLGHVIIDSGTYAVMAPNAGGGHEIHDIPDIGNDPLMQPSLAHPVLGWDVESPSQMVAVGKMLQIPGLTIIYVASTKDNNGGFAVRAVEGYPSAEMDHPDVLAPHILQRMLDYGAIQVLLYLPDTDDATARQKITTLMERVPPIRAAVMGRANAEHDVLARPKMQLLPTPRAMHVQDEPVDRWSDDEGKVIADLTQVGQFVFDDGATEFEAWKNGVLDMVGEGTALPYLAQVWTAVSGTPVPQDATADLLPKAWRRASTGTSTQKNVDRTKLVSLLEDALGRPIRVGRMARPANVLGVFRSPAETIRTRTAHDLPTIAHEAGHYISTLLWGYPRGLSNKARATFYGTHRSELMTLAQTHAKPSEEEGFAEFHRLYLTDRVAAAVIAPRLLAEVPRLIEAKDPDILAAFDTFHEQYHAWKSQDPFDRLKGHIVWDAERERVGVRETLNRMYEEMVYEFAPLDRAVKDLKARAGISHLPPDEDPSVLVQVLAGLPEVIGYFLYDEKGRGGAIDFATRRKVGPSLERVLEPVKDRLRDWQTYMVARRMQEIAGRTDDRAKRQTLALSRALEMTKVDVDQAVARHDSPLFQAAHDEFQEWNDHVLAYVRDAGLMTQDGYDKIKELNQSYIPFHRFFEDESTHPSVSHGRMANLGSPVKGMQGSGRPFAHPLATSIRNLYVFLTRAERHHVIDSLVRLAEKTPGGGLWFEPVPTAMQKSQVMLGEIRAVLMQAGVPAAILDQADLSLMATVFRPDLFKTQDNEVWVLRDGKPKHYLVQPDLYRALMFLDKSAPTWLSYLEQGSAPLRALAKFFTLPKQLLTVGATSALEFVARNPIRDVFMRAGVSEAPSKFPVPLVGPWVDLLDAAFGTLRGAYSAVRGDKWADALKRGGGLITGLPSMEAREIQSQLDDVIAGRDPESMKGWRLVNPVNYIKFLSNAFEQGTRIAETRDVLAARGVDPSTAALADLMAAGRAGRDVSGDWNRIGTLVRRLALNRVIAFYNPNIVGLDKFFRTLLDRGTGDTRGALPGGGGGRGGGGGQPPQGPGGGSWRDPGGFWQNWFGRGAGTGSTRGLRLLHYVLSTVTSLSILLWWLNHDDPRWDEIPLWQKNVAWIWMDGRVTREQWANMTDEQKAAMMRRTVWRMPKPFEIGVLFGSLPERILDAATGHSQAFASEVSNLMMALVGNILMPIPTAITPWMENYFNYNLYFDRKIEGGVMPDIEAVERVNPGTSHLAQWLARGAHVTDKALDKVLGLPSDRTVVPEMFRSPLQVDHLIYGYFAGVGRTAAQLVDTIVHHVDPNPIPAPTPTWADVPGVRGFVVRFPTGSAQSLNDFGSIWKHVESIHKTLTLLEKNEKDYEAYGKAHLMEVIAYKTLSQTNQTLIKIHASMRAIERSREMTPEAKRAELDRLTLGMIELARTDIQMYRETEQKWPTLRKEYEE